MDANIATARVDVAHKGRLLLGIQNRSGGAEKNHNLVTRQIRRAKNRRILGRINTGMMLSRQPAQCNNAIANRCMTKTGRLRKDEHVQSATTRRGRRLRTASLYSTANQAESE